MRLYPGDIVSVALGPIQGRAIVRQIDGGRVKIQIQNNGPTWLFSEELTWSGESLVHRLPRTERGWRKLAKVLS